MEIGKRITYLRTAKGYSTNKLATLSGISQSYLRDIELGKKNPTVEIVSILCETLGISLKDFFNEETEENLSADPLLTRIYQLSSTQRQTLLQFLDAMLE